jgi:hypothetical protein
MRAQSVRRSRSYLKTGYGIAGMGKRAYCPCCWRHSVAASHASRSAGNVVNQTVAWQRPAPAAAQSTKRREGPAPAAALLIDPVNQTVACERPALAAALETRSTKRQHGTQRRSELNQTAQHRAPVLR